jgi:hypothetical protein
MRAMTPALLEGALGLAARGIPVIPLRPRSKIPIHRSWPALGLLDPDSIRIEWEQHPDANVGVLCGPDALRGDGLVVIDIDMPDGWDTFETVQGDRAWMPTAPTVETPSGGRHFYYRGHAVSWNPGPGLEVRALGRQCAAPPSMLASGRGYTWMDNGTWDPDPLAGIEPVPWWLVAPTTAPAAERGTFTPSGLQDPVLEVPPPVYFRVLTGLTPDRHGFVTCPVHPFPDVEPSCKVYDTPDRGWFCYGEQCRKGGDVVSLVAHLAGIPTPVRGREFLTLLDYLAGRLL